MVYYTIKDGEDPNGPRTNVTLTIRAFDLESVIEDANAIARLITDDSLRTSELRNLLNSSDITERNGVYTMSCDVALSSEERKSVDRHNDVVKKLTGIRKDREMMAEGAGNLIIMEEEGLGKNYVRLPSGHRTGMVINEHGHRVPCYDPKLPSFVPQPGERS